MKFFNFLPADARARGLWIVVLMAGLTALPGSCSALRVPHQTQFWQISTLSLLALLSTRLSFAMPGAVGAVSPADVFIFLIGLFFGAPAATILAGVVGLMVALHLKRPAGEAVFTSATQTLAALTAFSAFYQLMSAGQHTAIRDLYSLQNSAPAMERLLLSSAVMLALYFTINSVLLSFFHALRRRETASELWIQNHLWSAPHLFLSGFAAVLVCLLVRSYGPVYLLVIAPLVAAGFATCRIYFDKVAASASHVAEIQRLHLATAEALATAIDAKDQTTAEHVRRVQIYATSLGRVFGLSEAEIEALRAGALLHDIGKLAVPDYILNKPGKLTAAEFEKMKIHTTVGAQILERVGFPYPVAPVVRYHHERWDGQGYPEGLSGEAIPMTARILSVVDCFDALRQDRPYHRGRSRERACQVLIERRGGHYDPKVVDRFLKLLPVMEREIAAAMNVADVEAIYASPKADDEKAADQLPLQPENGTGYLAQIKSAHDEVYSLYEIARTFGSSLNFEELTELLIGRLQHIVPFDTCVIYLTDEDDTLAAVECAAGKDADFFTGKQIYPGEGVTGWTLANRQIFANGDPVSDFRALKISAPHYRTVTALPLLKDELLIGIISLYSFAIAQHSADHLRLLETIAEIAADAFYNALHHQTTQEYALTDALTRLPNSRALALQFKKEVNRSLRENKPSCVLMMDLDGFKAVNDQHGHQKGDELLAGISQVIAEEMRSYDYLARYAGDEFVAILPGITEDALQELTSRIVNAVEAWTLPVRDEQSAGVGISIGAARFPAEGTSLERLLRIADRRMYKNKNVRKQHFLFEAGEGADPSAQILRMHLETR